MSNPQSASLADAFERALGVILARVSVSEPRIAVAYSGGLDSSVLLHLAHAYASAHEMQLFAFHVHHGLSDNADDWMRHCEAVSAALGVRYDARQVVLADCERDGVEQAARVSRYAALGDLCRKHCIPLLLTAHHLDDQAETILLQLLRGSGVAGLSGMEAVNTAPDLLGDPDLLIARPLLDVARSELEQFADEKRIDYVHDESNADPRYARNALRHKVMPALGEWFSGYQRRLARTAQHMQSAQRVLDEVASRDLAVCGDDDSIDIARLKELSPDRIDNLLRYWLASRGVRMPSTAWLDQMRDQLLGARAGAQVRVVHADGEVRRHRGRIFLAPRLDDAALTALPIVFRWSGEDFIHFHAFGGTLHFQPAAEGIDPSWLADQELQIQLRSGGEKLKLASNRPTRSLKHHYQALDIPAWERLRLPVVVTGSHLLYAAGIGMNWGAAPVVREQAIRMHWEKDPT